MKQSKVYILQSERNGRYYIGSSDDVIRRLKEHNAGKVASTRSIRPLILKVFLKCNTLTEAKAAEYRLKRYKRRDIIEKIIKDSTFPWEH